MTRRDDAGNDWGLGPHTYLHLLRLLAAYPELTVTSGRRSPKRNRAVGGSPRSFHLRGRAVDLVGPLELLREARRTASNQRVGPHCTGPEENFIEYVDERRQHLHLAW